MDSRMRNRSARLSSTIRIWSGREAASGSDGDCEDERRSLFGLGFDPDSATITLHDPLTKGESNTGARVFLTCMQPLKQSKNMLLVLKWNTNTVVSHGKDPESILPLA